MATNVSNVTQFSHFTLNEGVNAFDESTDAAKAISKVLDSTLKQPGARRVYTGVEIENPSTLWVFIDWETLEHHNTYRKAA